MPVGCGGGIERVLLPHLRGARRPGISLRGPYAIPATDIAYLLSPCAMLGANMSYLVSVCAAPARCPEAITDPVLRRATEVLQLPIGACYAMFDTEYDVRRYRAVQGPVLGMAYGGTMLCNV
eukprot:751183-Rhodomonas_salina.4